LPASFGVEAIEEMDAQPAGFPATRFNPILLAHEVKDVGVHGLRPDGAVSLTLKVLHFEGCKPLVEKAFYETAIV
jgi:hypothetical protein